MRRNAARLIAGAATVAALGVAAQVPDPPTAFSATPGDQQVTLTWQAPEEVGGSDVVGYEYLWKVAVSPDPGEWTMVGLATRAVVDGLENGESYEFHARALNSSGAGKAAQASAMPVGPPGAPAALEATAADSLVTLTWSAPEEDGGVPVSAYEYRWSSDTGERIEWTPNEDRTTVVVPELQNGVGYTFEVRAMNAADVYGEGAETTATPLGAPGAPVSLAAAPENGLVTLTWDAPEQDGGVPVSAYEYRWRTATGEATDWTSNDGRTTAVVSGLQNGVEYTFEVRTVNAADLRGEAAETTATPLGVPGAPASLAAVPGNGLVTLTWNAPEQDGGAAIAAYAYRWRSATGEESDWTPNEDRTTVVVSGLQNGVEYTFEVRAVNLEGAYSAEALATATPSGVPDTPVAVEAIVGDASVRLSWSVPADNGSPILRYEYGWKEADAPVSSDWLPLGLQTNVTVDELRNGVEYLFLVRAVNAAGAGEAAETTATPGIVVSAPAAPVLSAEAGDGTVALRWEQPDNDGGASILRYEYRWRPDGRSFGQWIETGLDRAATVGGLVNGVAYTFEVRAINGIGPGEAGSAGVTPAGLPGAPQLEARARSGVVDLSWSVPSAGGLTILDFDYRWGREDGAPGAWVDAGLQTAATIRGLDNGTTYAFEVRARNAVGHGVAALATATPSPNLAEDVLAKAWLSRFGRANAEHIVDAVVARTVATANPELSRSSPRAERTRRGRRPPSGRVEHFAPQDRFGPAASQMAGPIAPGRYGWDAIGGAAAGGPTMLFALAANGGAAGGSKGSWAGWGRVSGTRFAGEEGAAAVHGSVVNGTVGADYRRGRVLAGIAASHGAARGDFHQLARSGYPERPGEEVESHVTGIYPYMSYQGNWLSAWGVLGGGRGELSLTSDGPETKTEIASALAAAGAAGQLTSVVGVDLGVRTDAFVTQVSTTGDELADVDALTGRLRIALAASRAFELESGATFGTSLELGARQDSGDAEQGFGAELAGGIHYAAPGRLTLEARGSRVVAHQDEAFREWSGVVSVVTDPSRGGPDLVLRFGPSLRADDLWQMAPDRLGRGNLNSQPAIAELGYRFVAPSGLHASRPYLAMRTGGAGERTYRIGWQRLGRTMNLEFASAARKVAGRDWRYGVLLRATIWPRARQGCGRGRGCTIWRP